jgi:hypothetical protein
MSFINDIAFDERLAVLENRGDPDSRRGYTLTGRVP